jgi:hypothetical protein
MCLTEAALLAVLGRAALALWIGGLELSEFGESGSCEFSLGDEGVLDGIVLSVRSGVPQCGGMLFDLALDETSSF